MKILFYHPGRGGAMTAIGYYRIVKVAEQLVRAGWDVTVGDDDFLDSLGTRNDQKYSNVFLNYDVLWLSYFADERVAAAIFAIAERYGKKVVVDLDDNYLDALESSPIYDQIGRGTTKRAVIGAVLHFADHIVVSTEPLKERLESHFTEIDGYHPEITVIPNFSELGDWPEPKKLEKRGVTIGYVGSNSHQEDLKIVMPAIGNILKRHPEVNFRVVGGLDKRFLEEYFSDFAPETLMRVEAGASVGDFREWPDEFAKVGIDIGIAPLADNAFTRCKSHIKWMEYATQEIPCVASRVYPYVAELWGRGIIEDGETGFLVGNDGWEAALERLVTDAKLRERIGSAARADVAERWQYDGSGIPARVAEMLGVDGSGTMVAT